MTAPVPQELSHTLWNQLLLLGDDDRAGLDRINWQLRKLVKDQPTDFAARTSLAYGLLLGGDREGGLHQIEAARRYFDSYDLEEAYAYASFFIDIGREADARDYLTLLINAGATQGNRLTFFAMCAFGVRFGDVDWIDRSFQETGCEDEDVYEFLKKIKEDNLVSTFYAHQNIVNSIISPVSCIFDASCDIDDNGHPFVSIQYHTTLRGRDRLQLYRRIAASKTEPDFIKLSPFVTYAILGPKIQSVEVAA